MNINQITTTIHIIKAGFDHLYLVTEFCFPDYSQQLNECA